LQIWGKIVGGAAGFAIGGPLGALLGALAGHAFDYHREAGRLARPAARQADAVADDVGLRDEPIPIFADPAETRRIAFATAVIVLGAKLAKADGRVSRDEIRAFKHVFPIDDDEVADR
jgi:DnaJ like chaperone protein